MNINIPMLSAITQYKSYAPEKEDAIRKHWRWQRAVTLSSWEFDREYLKNDVEYRFAIELHKALYTEFPHVNISDPVATNIVNLRGDNSQYQLLVSPEHYHRLAKSSEVFRFDYEEQTAYYLGIPLLHDDFVKRVAVINTAKSAIFNLKTTINELHTRVELLYTFDVKGYFRIVTK